jgi:hypothetical protein
MRKEIQERSKSKNDLNKNKSLLWILIALFDVDDLKTVFIEIFNNIDLLMLYDKDDSYMWKCRKEIVELLSILKTRDYPVYYKSDKIDAFIRYMN